MADAPHVAEVVRRKSERSACLADRPLAVDQSLWHEARVELETILRDRGWPLVIDDRLAARGIDNFVCYGIPVVMSDDP